MLLIYCFSLKQIVRNDIHAYEQSPNSKS